MARSFASSSSQYLEIDQAAETAVPVTMAAWVYITTLAQFHGIVQLVDKDASKHWLTLSVQGDNTVGASARDGGVDSAASSTTTLSVNTWHHICGVWAAVDSRAALLDGGGKGTNSTSVTPAGLDRTVIGRYGDSTPGNYCDGWIAEAAIWDAALTDAEVAVLAAGFSPLFVRPQSLVAYWPLIRDTDDDIVGGYSMTPFNGPTVAAHAPVIYPGRVLLGVPTAAPPAAAALPVISGEGLHSLVFGGVTVR